MPAQTNIWEDSSYYSQQQNQQDTLSTIHRELPQNVDAEKSVLAACMLETEAMEEAAVMLKPENFYRRQHGIIFAAMLDLYVRNMVVDQLTVRENLRGKNQLEAVGGASYVVDLAGYSYSVANWREHAEIVKRTSVLRDLVHASNAINALAYNAPDDLSAVVEQSEKLLFDVTEKRVSSQFQPMAPLLVGAFEEIKKLKEQKGHMAGVPTGFVDVDNLFHGFRGGDLIILAARPGVGKTAFALNLAVNAAKAGTSVTFLSLEMSANQLVQRILCAEARVSLSKVRAGYVKHEDFAVLKDAAKRLEKLDMMIDDTPALSILELRAKARRELRGKEKGLIVVDYLQLMQPPSTRKDGNRAVEVAEISRGLKILAKEMDMPVLALSQLSRSIEQRGGKKRPQLSDLRESGSIEQDADIVMFIDRSTSEEEAESKGRLPLGEAELIVAKHRNGEIRDIRLSFEAEFTRFGDYSGELTPDEAEY
jgi:replicative DNA helicase